MAYQGLYKLYLDIVIDRRQRVKRAAIFKNKRLGSVLAYAADRQKELDMMRSKNASYRRGQAHHMFKPD